MAHNFKNLKIWQRAMDFTDLTYNYWKGLPVIKQFNLIDELNRSSYSVPSNIAEGLGKRTKLHFADYLTTSLTSSYEAKTQLLIRQPRHYGDREKLLACLNTVSEVHKMIFSFCEYILNNNNRNSSEL